jgi:hypothetical protein
MHAAAKNPPFIYNYYTDELFVTYQREIIVGICMDWNQKRIDFWQSIKLLLAGQV